MAKRRTPDDVYKEMHDGYAAYTKSKKKPKVTVGGKEYVAAAEEPAAESKKPAAKAKPLRDFSNDDPEAGWAQFLEDHKNGALGEDPHSPKRVHLLDERPDDQDLITDEPIRHLEETYTPKQLRALAEQGMGFVRSKNKKRTMAVRFPKEKK